MNSECWDCIFYYYERDTNFKLCKHPDYDVNKPDHCPGQYSKDDAKADAKYGHCDKY